MAFTVTFELLLLALRPLEQTLWDTRSGIRLRGRIDAHAERLRSGHTVRRLSSTAAIAAAALALPALLIAAGLAQEPTHKGAQPQRAAVRVVHVTKVVRPVTVRRVVAASQAPADVAPVVAGTRSARTRPTPDTRTEKPETSTEIDAPARESERDTVVTPEAPADGSSTKDTTDSPATSGASLDPA